MRVLVTGGAGYIGSHAVKALLEAGDEVVVFDSLFRGHRESLPDGVPLIVGDVRDEDAVFAALEGCDAVLHFAGLTYVGESVSQPLLYWDVNLGGSRSVLAAMKRAGVSRFVFSSTAATYGEPTTMPISEDTPQHPINPYGASKLAVEHLLRDLHGAWPELGYAALRYFNVAGCHQDGSIGEDHRPETHLIPVMLQAAAGVRQKVSIFGTDYPTPDGTCVRDYLHVQDLVSAHLLVLRALRNGDERHYNLGIGEGYSVRQVVDAVERVTGRSLGAAEAARRPGDPAELVTNPAKIREEIGWEATLPSLDAMVSTAWAWFEQHPKGYDS